MANERQTPSPEATSLNEPTSTPGGTRHAVNEGGDGYPELDALSFDPEGRDVVTRARRWIEENPVLAVAGAAAAGLLIGRAIAAAIPDPTPETFSEKVEHRAKEMVKHSRDVASDAGEVVGRQLAVAAEALNEASKAVADGTRKGYSEAKDFSEFLAQNIGKAVADRAGKWLDSR